MAYLFTDKSGWEGTFIDSFAGGLVGGIGQAAYKRIAQGPITNMVGGVFGKYANAGAAYVWDLILNVLSEKAVSDARMQAVLKVAGYTPLANALAVAFFGDPPAAPTATHGRSPWGQLSPIPLARTVYGPSPQTQ